MTLFISTLLLAQAFSLGDIAFPAVPVSGDGEPPEVCETALEGNTDTQNGHSLIGSTASILELQSPILITNDGTRCGAMLYISKTGAPAFNVSAVLRLRDPGTGHPGTIIATSAAIAAASLHTSESNWWFAFTSPSTVTNASFLAAGLRVDGASNTANAVQWWRNSGAGQITNDFIFQSADGSTWTTNSSTRNGKAQLYGP